MAESYHMTEYSFSCVRNRQTVCQNGCIILRSASSEWESSFCSTASEVFVAVCVWDFSHFNGCTVLSHFLICHSWHVLLNTFCLFCFDIYHLYILFGEISVQIFYWLGLFIFVCYCWVLRILCLFWTQVLHQVSVLQIFLPVCGFSCPSLKTVFHIAKVLISVSSILSILPFIDCISV